MGKIQISPLNYLYLAWFIALAGVFGSLFFSEILNYPPCPLCWYQRLFLYPLALLLPLGILLRDKNIHIYGLSFVAVGLLIAIYHNLFYYGWISQSFSTCTGEVSCSARQLELLGFITIPLLSLASFLGIFLLLLAFARTDKFKQEISS